jgi:hypothetical protein
MISITNRPVRTVPDHALPVVLGPVQTLRTLGGVLWMFLRRSNFSVAYDWIVSVFFSDVCIKTIVSFGFFRTSSVIWFLADREVWVLWHFIFIGSVSSKLQFSEFHCNSLLVKVCSRASLPYSGYNVWKTFWKGKEIFRAGLCQCVLQMLSRILKKGKPQNVSEFSS